MNMQQNRELLFTLQTQHWIHQDCKEVKNSVEMEDQEIQFWALLDQNHLLQGIGHNLHQALETFVEQLGETFENNFGAIQMCFPFQC